MTDFSDSTGISPSSAGALLGEARRRQGLSVADVARQLKLAPPQVEALESNRFDRLPGHVFVRGFIRNYARLLKLDPAPLLESADRARADPVARGSALTASPVPFSSGGERRRPRRFGLIALAAAVVIGLLAFQAYRDRLDNLRLNRFLGTVGAERTTVEMRAGAVPAPTVAPLQPLALPPEPAEAGPVPPSSEPASAAAGHRMALIFDRQAWVQVKDRNGTVFSKLASAGSRETVDGTPPFALVVGNAAHVQVEYDGKPVDLAAHTKGDVARLSLE